MHLYKDEELQKRLEEMNSENWKIDSGCLTAEFGFHNFREAFSFMYEVAKVAENMDHHPDWSNVYNKLSIKLSTHSVGALTDKDFRLAEEADRIYHSAAYLTSGLFA